MGRAVDAGHPPDPGEGRTTPVRQKWTGPAHHRSPRAPVNYSYHSDCKISPEEPPFTTKIPDTRRDQHWNLPFSMSIMLELSSYIELELRHILCNSHSLIPL